jgi:hypothetical protein
MITAIIKNELAKKRPIPLVEENSIRDAGVITGSKVFGGHQQINSDTDWILPPTFKSNRLGLGSDFCFYISGEYRNAGLVTYYCKVKEGDIWNIIHFDNQDDFDIWEEATSILRQMKIRSSKIARALKYKTVRIAMFEMIKASLSEAPYYDVCALKVKRYYEEPLPIGDDDIPF